MLQRGAAIPVFTMDSSTGTSVVLSPSTTTTATPGLAAQNNTTIMSHPTANSRGTGTTTTMKPPPPVAVGGGGGVANAVAVVNHMQAEQQKLSNDVSSYSDSVDETWSDKKLQKRAANRKSAQLSRKRKKQFIEELKDENDELRRKEEILRAIPDLIVVFDSSGRLNFVSESAGRFLDMSSDELQGKSFWDRLCDDSVRLLKAAFMDSLAARQDGSDTAPLGNGVWELRLVDKKKNYMVINLNGVVHFKGDAPECVCSIRPSEDGVVRKLSSAPVGFGPATTAPATTTAKASTVGPSRRSVSNNGNDDVSRFQSVVRNEELASNSSSATENGVMASGGGRDHDQGAARKRRQVAAAQVGNGIGGGDNDGSFNNTGGQAVRISDGDSEGVDVSESGSDDGVTSSGSN